MSKKADSEFLIRDLIAKMVNLVLPPLDFMHNIPRVVLDHIPEHMNPCMCMLP